MRNQKMLTCDTGLEQGLTGRDIVELSGIKVFHILILLWGYADVCIHQSSLNLRYVHYTAYKLYLNK